jgi:hypothetical protein
MTPIDAFERALGCLDSTRLAKSQRSRQRYEQRQIRLDRLKLALAHKRSQVLLDPMARALAKAKALAGGSE